MGIGRRGMRGCRLLASPAAAGGCQAGPGRRELAQGTGRTWGGGCSHSLMGCPVLPPKPRPAWGLWSRMSWRLVPVPHHLLGAWKCGGGYEAESPGTWWPLPGLPCDTGQVLSSSCIWFISCGRGGGWTNVPCAPSSSNIWGSKGFLASLCSREHARTHTQLKRIRLQTSPRLFS